MEARKLTTIYRVSAEKRKTMAITPDTNSRVTEPNGDVTEPATEHDIAEGGLIGGVGGALIGALAGGPVGAIVGGVLGAAASAAAVAAVDTVDSDYSQIEESGSNQLKQLSRPMAPINTYTGADYRGIDDVNYDIHSVPATIATLDE
jgi:uncharacterized protein YcfJ